MPLILRAILYRNHGMYQLISHMRKLKLSEFKSLAGILTVTSRRVKGGV